MNRKGGVFTAFFVVILIGLVLLITALMAPSFIPIIKMGTTNSGVTGIEKLIIDNIYFFVFAFGGLAIILVKFLDFGGEE
jgi:hypothetical protein